MPPISKDARAAAGTGLGRAAPKRPRRHKVRFNVRLIAEPQRPKPNDPRSPGPRWASGAEAFENASHWRSLAVALVKTSRDCVKLIDLEGCVVVGCPAGRRLLQLDDPARLVGLPGKTGRPRPSAASCATASSAAGAAKFRPPGILRDRQGRAALVGGPGRAGGRRERRLRCMLATSRDVTALREREQEMQDALKRQRRALLSLSADFEANSQRLRDAEARASHDDKLRLFGRFVGGVVHSFNNVFAAVHSAARLLRRRVASRRR